MDPERQPLLRQGSELRLRRIGALTPEEVQTAGQEISWRRTRFCLVIMFWALIAMFLSIITCILATAPKCNMFDRGLSQVPSVPPVHMSFAPLIYSLRDPGIPRNSDGTYAL